MFTITTPSKKEFEVQYKSLPLPEALAEKVSKLLHVEVELTSMQETKSEVLSDKSFGHVPMGHIEVTYYGTCRKGNKVGKIRFIAVKQKWFGYYERL